MVRQQLETFELSLNSRVRSTFLTLIFFLPAQVIDVGPDLGEGLDTLPESGRDRSKKAKKSDDGAQPVAAKAFSEKTVSAVAASQKRRRQAKRRMEADEDPSKFSEAAAAEPGSLKRLARKQKDSLRAHKQSKSHLESVKTSGKVATERQAVSAATKQLESAQAAKKHCRAPNGSAPIFGGGEASPTTDAAPLGARKGCDTSHCAESNNLKCMQYHSECQFIRPHILRSGERQVRAARFRRRKRSDDNGSGS